LAIFDEVARISVELMPVSGVPFGVSTCSLVGGLPLLQMDLHKTIQDLYAEKEKLERVIASLEELQRAADSNAQVMGRTKRRGRKSMGSEERQEVSERMKKYWAGRRGRGPKQPPGTDKRVANGS
jgi:hypothetical protein